MSTYTVQSIIDRRGQQKNQREYLIKWKGYSISDSTWEPMKNLIYVKQMIIDFDEKYDQQNQQKKQQASSEGNNDSKKQALKALQARRSNRGKAKKAPNQDEMKQTKRQLKKQNIFKNTKSNSNVFSPEPQEQSIHSKYLASIQQEHLNTIKSNMKLEEISDKGDKATDEGNNSKENKREAPQIEENIQELLQILGMRKNESGEYFFLVQSSTGLTSYKTREYLVKNYPEALIIFYESKMIFVEDKNLH